MNHKTALKMQKRNVLVEISSIIFALTFTVLVMVVLFNEWETYSDNIIYKIAFQRMEDKSIVDAYVQFVSLTAGVEPLTFFLFWVFSKFTTYFEFLFVFNFVLCFVFFKLIHRATSSFFYACIALFFNYYIIVMMVGIQRFKFAFIFLMLTILLSTYKTTFSILAISSHLQSLIALPAFTLARMRVDAKKLVNHIAVLAVVLIIIYIVNPDAVQNKLIGRIGSNWQDLIKSILLASVSALFIKSITYGNILSFVFLCLVAFVLGGFRINILIYFLSTYLILNQTGNSIRKKSYIIFSSLYLLYKSLELYYGHYNNNLFIDGDIGSIIY